MTDYTHLIETIITLVVTLITMFVIPWIKQKISADKLSEIMKWVKIAVQAAEMIYKESGMGKEKKAYVEKFLTDLGVKFDSVKIDSLIESAVLEMKHDLKTVDNKSSV